MKQTASVLDVRQFIDDRPFSRYQLSVAVMCGLVVFLDGFDAQVMGFVAVAMTAAFEVTRLQFGYAISGGLFGMMVGALVCGPLADRFGRKPILVGCAFTFGVGSLLTATADSLQSLILFRVLTGLGLGGAMPNTIALTSEYSPKKVRATAVMLMFCGFSVGAAVGGFVSARLVSLYGWQSVFIVGGVVPCLVGLVSLAALPESIRFLVVRGQDRKKIFNYLSKIAPGFKTDADVSLVVGESQTKSGVKELFAAGRPVITLLFWVMFFMNLLDLYFLNSWLPTVLNDLGIHVETASYITSLFQIGGTCGALLLGRLMDRLLSFKVLGCTFLAASASVVLLGAAGASIPLLVLVVFITGFFVIGGQTSSNALASEFYPTAIRSTGVGWALGIGRIGSIIGPSLGATLVTPGVHPRQVFWAAAVPPLIAMAAAFSAARAKGEKTAA